jgi:hypothetical protein
MKHLKIYEEFDSVDEIVNNAKEILFDFSDDGNDVTVSNEPYLSITVIIKNKTHRLDADTFIRLFTYLKEFNYTCFNIFTDNWKIPIGDNIVDCFNQYIEEINECRHLQMIFSWHKGFNSFYHNK